MEVVRMNKEKENKEETWKSYFLDECDSLWDLSANYQFVIDDCPLIVDIPLQTSSHSDTSTESHADRDPPPWPGPYSLS